MKRARELVAIIHNVRSLHNVGSIFRTADGAGIRKIYLTGYTPTPVDEMRRPRKEIEKTALGAEKTIDWEYVQSPTRLIKKLRKSGYRIVALEKSTNATSLWKTKITSPAALLVGNEVQGISKSLLSRADAIVEIPMRGKKESLNVSVAFGIAVYALLP